VTWNEIKTFQILYYSSLVTVRSEAHEDCSEPTSPAALHEASLLNKHGLHHSRGTKHFQTKLKNHTKVIAVFPRPNDTNHTASETTLQPAWRHRATKTTRHKCTLNVNRIWDITFIWESPEFLFFLNLRGLWKHLNDIACHLAEAFILSDLQPCSILTPETQLQGATQG